MGKALVIVESPAKAKTINKYLGNDYVVKSSVGHIRDLPTSGSATKKSADSTSTKTAKKPKKDERGALVNRMGVDPWHNWDARYEVLPGKEKVVSELKQLAEKADHIYLATDLDREGEAIAWHLREVIGGDDTRYSRVVFNEITKNAIRQAFEKAGRAEHRPRQCATGAPLYGPCCGLYGVAAAVEKNCARPVSRPRTVGCRASGG